MFDFLNPLTETLGVPLGFLFHLKSDQLKLIIALYLSLAFGIAFRSLKQANLRYIVGLVLGVLLQIFVYGNRLNEI